MKQGIIILAIIVVAGCYGSGPDTVKTGLEGKPMPAIELLSADSVTTFNTSDIAPGKPTILFAFTPSCPYCRAQTKAITSQIEKLKDMNIFMLTPNLSHTDLRNFIQKYELTKYPNIRTGIDRQYTFVNYFKAPSVPYLAVYGSDKRLKQVFVGKNYIQTIREAALN